MEKITINNKEYTLKKIAEALSCNIENIDKLYVSEKLEEKRKEKNRLRTTKNRVLKKINTKEVNNNNNRAMNIIKNNKYFNIC